MGLSSKQVSSDGNNGWNNESLLEESSKNTPPIKNQQQLQLNCPRCDSTNTKFCYYNNYNKSQPRHFCKACKRHWTKGGTLRNVPVGGGRKNKRLKTSKTAFKPTTTTTNNNNNLVLQSQQLRGSSPPFEGSFNPSSSFSSAFYQNFLKQQRENSITFTSKGLNDGFYIDSTMETTSLGLSTQPNDHQELQFPCTNLGSFDSNPCSISSTITSNQSPILYNFTGDHANNNNNNNNNNNDSNNNNGMDMMSSSWGWDDFDKFVSVEADLTIPWDDSDIKP